MDFITAIFEVPANSPSIASHTRELGLFTNCLDMNETLDKE